MCFELPGALYYKNVPKWFHCLLFNKDRPFSVDFFFCVIAFLAAQYLSAHRNKGWRNQLQVGRIVNPSAMSWLSSTAETAARAAVHWPGPPAWPPGCLLLQLQVRLQTALRSAPGCELPSTRELLYLSLCLFLGSVASKGWPTWDLSEGPSMLQTLPCLFWWHRCNCVSIWLLPLLPNHRSIITPIRMRHEYSFP